ncbi:secreted protein, partial [Candidatus Magnetomorum sp. HK-1]
MNITLLKKLIFSVIATIVLFGFFGANTSVASFIIHPSSTQNQSQEVSIPLTLNNLSYTDIGSI